MNFEKRIVSKIIKSDSTGPVLVWMSRDFRVADNWTLLAAQEKAVELNQPMAVYISFSSEVLLANERQRKFLKASLVELEKTLTQKNIPLLVNYSQKEILLDLLKELSVSNLFCDFLPLRHQRDFLNKLSKKSGCNIFQIDNHNIVPCLLASDKKEFGARTIRPKINRQLDVFLSEFPKLKKQTFAFALPSFDRLRKIEVVTFESGCFIPGEKAGLKMMHNFFEKQFNNYAEKRNDPNASAVSDLSPYLHFGMIAPQRVALEAGKYLNQIASYESFTDELIIRRELSDNFCYYETDYDNFNGFPDWSKLTLNDHRSDPRSYLYSTEQFEQAKTHDDLWNAAQQEMVSTGKMHGYLRMYWAKKILEWSVTPENALSTAIYLNDKYELDGCDPNGYAGVAWSIGGVHDRAWFEREIFGKIRYMNDNGCKRKFEVNKYIKQFLKF